MGSHAFKTPVSIPLLVNESAGGNQQGENNVGASNARDVAGWLDFLIVEYQQTIESYRHTYHTIWQSGSIFIASGFLLIAFLVQASQVQSILTLGPIALITFWWLGVFEPMNRYGDWRMMRASTIEHELGDLLPFPGQTAPTHFRALYERKAVPFHYDSQNRTWKPLRYFRVRWAVRIGISSIDVIFVLALVGVSPFPL